jgi:redox-sensing transcriptional repressor
MPMNEIPVNEIPIRTIERLSLYRQLLNMMQEVGQEFVFSHELAHMGKKNPAQVRRDLMVIGCGGSTRRGYEIKKLIERIRTILDDPQGQKMAMAGIGNLGRAILAYFMGHRPNLSITVAFDVEPDKINRVIAGCRTYHVDRLEEIVRQQNIKIGIITVPALAAQQMADRFVKAGVKAMVNWAPIPLHVPPDVCLENRDITMSIEKAAFFAKNIK